MDVDGFVLDVEQKGSIDTDVFDDVNEVEEMIEQLKSKVPAADQGKESNGEGGDGDTTTASIISDLESRLQAFRARVVSMESRTEELAAEKEQVRAELRESRIAVEMVTQERNTLSTQLKKQEKALQAAKKLAAEREAALQAQSVRGDEFAAEIAKVTASSEKEKEDELARFQAKITALSADVELLNNQLREGKAEAATARVAQQAAEDAIVAAEEARLAEEQNAIAAMNELAQLKSQQSESAAQSAELVKDNERRQKTFSAAVEAQVQRFRAGLEAERDAALSKLEESYKSNAELEGRLREMGEELAALRSEIDQEKSAVATERTRLAEYEQLVASLRNQVAVAVQAQEQAVNETTVAQQRWDVEKKELENVIEGSKREAEGALKESAKLAEDRLRMEIAEWRAAAKVSELAVEAARQETESAVADCNNLRKQIEEMEAVSKVAQIVRSGMSTPPTEPRRDQEPTTAGTTTTPLSLLPSFLDLESLRRTPLLPTTMPGRGSSGSGSGAKGIASARQLLLWGYMVLVTMLLLVSMSRYSHAHLACEQHLMVEGRGALP